jgi:hypothetical protein
MRRWVVEKLVANDQHELLQVCIVHPEEDNKVRVKEEHKRYTLRRYLIKSA